MATAMSQHPPEAEVPPIPQAPDPPSPALLSPLIQSPSKSSSPSTPNNNVNVNASAKSNLPPPPAFPSMKDITTTWPDDTTPNSSPSKPSPTDDAIAWTTPQSHSSSKPRAAPPAATSTTPHATAQPSTSTDGKPGATTTAAKPPVLQRAKSLICKLPDPTLVFLLEAIMLLTIHHTHPALLHTWAARIVTPLLLLPTVVATALWRPTVVSAVEGRVLHTPVRPVPNSAKIVARGEALRKRELAVVKAEEELRAGQMKLEVLRRDVELKLPPAVTISNMLASESDNT